ncbi:MAG: ROK family protein [Candidatus Aminicenantes bacterium]|nr:ROK family protein [Candidatus Aminicenantes bacterium]
MRLLGVDVGGTNIKAGIVSEGGEVIESRIYPSPRDLPSLFLLFERISSELSPFDAAGFGIAGLWDEGRKKIRFAPNIPYISDAEIWDEIQRSFPGAMVQNDANVAAFGELLFGRGRTFDSFIYLTLGTGIGGGIIHKGKLIKGKNGFAGEVGHMIINPDGVKCGCGARGCWETEASASALERKYFEKTGKRISAKKIWERAKAGEKTAEELYRNVATWLGRGIVSLINIFDPDAIILGGGLSEAGEILFAPLRDYVRKNSYVFKYGKIDILPSSLGYMSGVIGAAAYGWKGKE